MYLSLLFLKEISWNSTPCSRKVLPFSTVSSPVLGPTRPSTVIVQWPRGTLYPQKLALTSPTSGGRSVDIVRSRTQATEFNLVLVYSMVSFRGGMRPKVEAITHFNLIPESRLVQLYLHSPSGLHGLVFDLLMTRITLTFTCNYIMPANVTEMRLRSASWAQTLN
jgi:hypothetical protein